MLFKLTIKSLDKVTLNLYTIFLIKMLNKLSFVKYSYKRLPVRKKRITLLKSPHVNKKAMDQFEIRIQKVHFVIKNLNSLAFVKQLMFNKPKHIKIKFSYKNI